MSWAALRIEAGFFAFYSALGFCLICLPVEVIGAALGANVENLLASTLALTIGSATVLRIYTRDVVTEELRRQRQLMPLENWREFQESMK